MIVFELTMPNRGSWNGKWSGDDRKFIRLRKDREVPKNLVDKSYTYSWDDGWTACVTLTKIPADKAHKLERKSDGFCGYDWMIESIIRYGKILSKSDLKDEAKV